MGIENWSTTALENDDADLPGVNWQEGQTPGSVNNSARGMMAAIRSQWEQREWFDFGDEPTRTGDSTFTVPGDLTSRYVENRPIRCTDSSTLYGIIASSSHSGGTTTVQLTLDSGTLSANLSAVALGVTPTNKPIHVSSVRGALDGSSDTLTSPVINNATGLGQTIIKRKTDDESVTSSTTVQDDDDLAFAIGADEEWIADFYIVVGESLSTTGVKIKFDTPSGSSIIAPALFRTGGAWTQVVIESSITTVNITSSLLGGGKGVISIHLHITNGSTAGNVTLQWAQSSSSGTAVTFFAGSYLLAKRIA